LAGLAVLGLIFMLVSRKQETLRVKAVLAGEQQERRRISQEMHDDMGSGLTRLLFLTRSLIAGHEAAPKISDAVNGLIRQMNELIWMMNNERDTLESLVAYLRAACGELLDAAGIAMIFEAPDKLPDLILTQVVRRNIYLAVKEAVHNACKHSGASMVAIAILTDRELAISVQDNGQGLAMAGSATGNGLGNMRQRMKNIGGNFEMVSEAGTLLRFSVPLSI
jgi:signal transduction histidine kinase